MAACTFAISLASTSNLSSYTTASFTPAAGDLLVVFVTATGTVATGTVTGTDVATFTKAGQRVMTASADTAYCFIGNAFATATSQTVTFDCTGDAATGCIIQVYLVSGMSRLGNQAAVRQLAGQSNQTLGAPSPSFAASADTSNPTLGLCAKKENTGIIEPTGWTEGDDVGYTTPATRGEVCHRDSGFTGTNITWGSVISVNFCDIIIELDTSAPPANTPNGLMMTGMGI